MPDLPLLDPASNDPDAPAGADPRLRARLEALEARVAALEARRPAPMAPARERTRRLPTWRLAEARSEDLLGKLGVALLLVGVLFLLRWTIEQGLLTAAVRVAGVGVLGAGLVAAGTRLRAARPVLARLLAGGGLAALYGALWTAAVLYPALPTVAAFAGLALVAALGLGLATQQADGALATVATAGGLVTPLLLYRAPEALGLLALYAALVLGAGAAVYARRGWPGLLAALALGGWGVVLTAWLVDGGGPAVAGRVPFTVVVLAAWAASAALPLIRPAIEAPRLPFAARPLTWAPLLGAALLVPALSAAWSLPRAAAVVLAVAVASAYALVAWRSLSPGATATPSGSPSHRFAPAALAAATVAVWSAGRAFGFWPPDARWLAAAVVAGSALVLVARRARERETAYAGHALALGATAALLVALWVVVGMPWQDGAALEASRLVRLLAASALGVGALGAVGVRSARHSTARAVYLTAAHLVGLAGLRVLLLPMANGAALTSAAWGLVAVALVVVGLRRREGVVRGLGLGTIVGTAAKVLLVDLPAVPMIWRVVLFMGLGALLLAVSYAVPGLLRRPADDPPPAT